MLALWQAQALPWLYDATRLELDAMQGYFFRGAVTEVSIEEQTDAWAAGQGGISLQSSPAASIAQRPGRMDARSGHAHSPALTAQTATGSGTIAPGLL